VTSRGGPVNLLARPDVSMAAISLPLPAMDAQKWKTEQKKLRDALRAHRRTPDGRMALPPPEEAELPELYPLDLLRTPIVSHRGAPGRVVVEAKRMLRRLLAPFVLEPQTRFNHAVVAALMEQRERLVEIARLLHAPDESGADVDYYRFEERFRGSSEAIASRQTEYLDYFYGRENVLDVGCGRGEFLAMLRERGTPAQGVDLDPSMIARCREQDLTVDCAEAVEFLNRQPDGAFGGVFMSQLVEHLSTEHLVTLLDAIGRKTSRGAVLIVETINPESLPVLMRWFWLDPTHVRLVHPETLQYFIEKAGFTVKTVQFRREIPNEELLPALALPDVAEDQLAPYNAAIAQINARLFGPLEYFVVGQSEA
jgi:2-polyprenyl-3-methyl-5-hydroxy-6-metoxy-1,4-benzoquinol methylase